MLRVAEVDQRVQVGHGAEHDVAATPAVAAVRPAEGDVFLTPERDHAVAAVARAEINLGFIQELHALGCRRAGRLLLPLPAPACVPASGKPAMSENTRRGEPRRVFGATRVQ
jgi:hypothetical protein